MFKRNFLKSLPTIGTLAFLGLYFGLNYLRHYNSTLVRSNREAVHAHNEQVNQLRPVMDSLRAALKDLRVYTNDTGRLRLHLRAAIDVQETVPIGFVIAQAEANGIQDFLKHRASRGFNLFLESNRGTVLLMNLTQDALKEEQKWKIVGSYYYSESIKETLKENLKKRAAQYELLNITLDKDINDLNKLQTEIAVVSETELKNRRLKWSFANFARLRIGELKVPYLGYIATYNKTTSKEEFKNRLPELKDMFFKYPDSTANYSMRELEIVVE